MAPGRGCVFFSFPCRAGARESPSLSVLPAAPRAALFFPPPLAPSRGCARAARCPGRDLEAAGQVTGGVGE